MSLLYFIGQLYWKLEETSVFSLYILQISKMRVRRFKVNSARPHGYRSHKTKDGNLHFLPPDLVLFPKDHEVSLPPNPPTPLASLLGSHILGFFFVFFLKKSTKSTFIAPSVTKPGHARHPKSDGVRRKTALLLLSGMALPSSHSVLTKLKLWKTCICRR